MKFSTKWKSAALAMTVGAATVALFQNCSSGSLPPDLTQTSSTSEPVTARLPLVINTASTVVAGATTLVSTSGGTGSYVFTATAGAVTLDSVLGGYVFTAPAVTGAVVITVTDSAQSTASATITVTAASPNPPPVATSTSKPIYEFIDPSAAVHIYSDNVNFMSGGSSTPKYFLVADSNTGAVPYYRCSLPQPLQVMSYFNTTSANCEGQNTAKVQIGFIYTDGTHPNTVPLYRYNITLLGMYLDHVDSLSSTRPPGPPISVGGTDPSLLAYLANPQYNPDGPMGWVPIN